MEGERGRGREREKHTILLQAKHHHVSLHSLPPWSVFSDLIIKPRYPVRAYFSVELGSEALKCSRDTASLISSRSP